MELIIYDILGKEIFSYDLSSQSTGLSDLTWNGKDKEGKTVSSGIYVYKLKAISRESDRAPFIKASKMLFIE